jgi:ParB family chromosome partitioning protein
MKRSLNTLIESTDVRGFKVVEIQIQKISESKSQARTYFDPKKLEELSESIKKSGVLQPIIVQDVGNDRYQLIAGERRLRASKLSGLKTIPCLVKDVSDKDAAVLGLVENVQRSQLNTIEEALGYKSLKETYGLNAKEIGLLVGKSRPFIANLLRISNLSNTVQEALKNEKISFGQARPLIVLDHNLQDKLLVEIIQRSMNSRQVEEKVSELNGKSMMSEEVLHAKNELENLVGSKVQVKKTGKSFKVNLNFQDFEKLKQFINNLS